MKKCKYCRTEIDEKAKICPNCKKDLRNFLAKNELITGIIVVIVLLFAVVKATNYSKTIHTVSNNHEEEVKSDNENEQIIKGQDIELFPGTYIVGEDVVPGKYDVQAIKGMGNFFVYGDGYLGGIKVNQAFSANEKQSQGLFGSTYNNLNLKVGDKIETNSNLVVKLIAK